MNQALEELLRSINNFIPKLNEGFPALSATTVLKNRMNEVNQELKEQFEDPDVDKPSKMEALITYYKSIANATNNISKVGVKKEAVFSLFLKQVQELLTDNDILEHGTRSRFLDEVFTESYYLEFDLHNLEISKYTTNPQEWIKEFQTKLNNIKFLTTTLEQTPFIEFDNFVAIFGNVILALKTTLTLIEEIDFDDSDKLQETTKERNFLLIEAILTFLKHILIISERVNFELFENMLSFITDNLENREFIKHMLSITNEFLAKFPSEFISEFSSQKFGGPDQVKGFLNSAKIISTFYEQSDKLKLLPYGSQLISDELLQIATNIELYFREFSCKSIFLNKINEALIRYYRSIYIILVVELDHPVERFVNQMQWASTIFENEASTNHAILSLFGTQLGLIKFATDKGNIELLKEQLKDLERLLQSHKNLAPYPNVTMSFLTDILSFVLNHKSGDEVEGNLQMTLLSETIFIPNHDLIEQFRTYLAYFSQFNSAIKDNLQKPRLELELEVLNSQLQFFDPFKILATLDFYTIKGNFMELKYPIFGSLDFSIYQTE